MELFLCKFCKFCMIMRDFLRGHGKSSMSQVGLRYLAICFVASEILSRSQEISSDGYPAWCRLFLLELLADSLDVKTPGIISIESPAPPV
jgi:hypothetical protein